MRNLFFVIVFIFIGFVSYSSTNSITKNILSEYDSNYTTECSDTLEEIINISNLSFDLGWCTFSYTITVTNNLTGESTTTPYTQTVPASSQADCNAAAINWIRGQVNAIRASLN